VYSSKILTRALRSRGVSVPEPLMGLAPRERGCGEVGVWIRERSRFGVVEEAR
jgi:hypothetical protein